MNTKLKVDKELAHIPDQLVRFREDQVKRIEYEYGYDRNTAAKVYEYQEFKSRQMMFNAAAGAFAAYKVGPFQKEAALVYPLFRKAWMRLPIGAVAFGGAYWMASLLQMKFFPKYFSYNYYRVNTGE